MPNNVNNRNNVIWEVGAVLTICEAKCEMSEK